MFLNLFLLCLWLSAFNSSYYIIITRLCLALFCLQWSVYSEIAQHNMLSMFFPPWSHTSTDFFLSVSVLFAAAHQQTISPVPIRCGFAQCSSHCTVSPPRFGGRSSRESLMHSCISYTCTPFSQCVRENSDWCWWWWGGRGGQPVISRSSLGRRRKTAPSWVDQRVLKARSCTAVPFSLTVSYSNTLGLHRELHKHYLHFVPEGP